MREQQVNDALRALDEMHRLGRIERDAYRQRRRRLLDSLRRRSALRWARYGASKRPCGCRTAPARADSAARCRQRADACRRGRSSALWMLLLLVAVAGALAAGWLMLTR